MCTEGNDSGFGIPMSVRVSVFGRHNCDSDPTPISYPLQEIANGGVSGIVNKTGKYSEHVWKITSILESVVLICCGTNPA